jgi:hypothetical protein
MTRTSVHRHGEILRTVITVADTRRDGLLPLDVAGVREAFVDELDLLGALQLRWHTRLAGRLDRELATEPMDLEASVVGAWRHTATAMPGVRAVLDHYLAFPVDDAMAAAVTTATAKERAMLAVAAGRCATGDAAAPRVGAAVEARARAATRPPGNLDPSSRRLRDRIRAAFAA